MARLEIVYLKTSDLVPYARNPRKNDEAVSAIAASIKEFGFKNPIIIDNEKVIVAGHTRLKAAQQLGLEQVPTIQADDLTPEQIKAYRLLDNKLSEKSEWDGELLGLELSEMDFDFGPFDVDFDLDVGTEPTEVAEVETPVELPIPVTKPGDLWMLGRSRILCGDSTNSKDVVRLIAGNDVQIMITDPPYGVNLDQSWRDKALGAKAMGPGNKNLVSNDDRADWTEVWKNFAGDIAYVWHAGKFSDVVMASLRSAGFDVCQQLIWNKSVMVMGRSDYHFKHEPCWYAVRKGKAHRWIGDRTQTTVIEAKSPNHIMSGSDEEKTDHPTQKPVECMAYLLRNHSGSVFDPFLGSGTTLVAAEQLDRACYGMEISRNYTDIAVQRWQILTGQDAILESTGETFEEIRLRQAQ